MVDFLIRYWVEFLLAILAGGVVALTKGVIAVFAGQRALLRDRIIQLHDHYTNKGYCPIYALDNAHSMYKAYRNLKGNGTVTQLMDEIEALPRKGKEL